MTDNPIQIARLQDAHALVELLTLCAQHLHQQGMSHWLSVYDAQSVRQNLLQKTVYILRQNNKIIGCAALGKKPADYYAACWPDAPTADFYLTQLAVQPAYQQAGYGRLLLQHCLTIIGNQTVQLDAVTHYPALLNFYQKAGFKKIATGIGLGDQRFLFEYQLNKVSNNIMANKPPIKPTVARV